MGECKLCKEDFPLRASHLIPKFIFRWLKKGSPNKKFRSTEVPNRAIQDGLKVPLLCDRCENLFGKRENLFRNEIFIPYVEKNQRDFLSEKWLLYFAVSLSWRTAKYGLLLGNFDEPTTDRIEKELSQWEHFLLNPTSNISIRGHHIFLYEFLSDLLTEKRPIKYSLTYLTRATDSQLIAPKIILNGKPLSPQPILAYTKLPNMIFMSFIDVINPNAKQTEIIPGKNISQSQIVADPIFRKFLLKLLHNRINEVSEAEKEISSVQKEKIFKLLQEDLTSGSPSEVTKMIFWDHFFSQSHKDKLKKDSENQKEKD